LSRLYCSRRVSRPCYSDALLLASLPLRATSEGGAKLLLHRVALKGVVSIRAAVVLLRKGPRWCCFAARYRELRACVSQATGGGLLSALFKRAGSQSQTMQAWRKAERAKSSAAARGSGAVRTSAQSSRYSPS
jgi:hypothetical protein